jgi:hypothetical protein
MIDWGVDIDLRLPFFFFGCAIYPSVALLCVYSYITYISQQQFFYGFYYYPAVVVFNFDIQLSPSLPISES